MPSKPKHKYDIAEIQAAMNESGVDPNYAKTARKLKMPKNTLKGWCDRNLKVRGSITLELKRRDG